MSKFADSKTTAVDETTAVDSRGHYAPDTSSGSEEHNQPQLVNSYELHDRDVPEGAIDAIESKRKVWYAYLTTPDFYYVLIIG